MKILIAGAGIGGLSAALSCAHFGHEVHIYEKASALTDVGAGIQLPPNAMKIFRALGVDSYISQDAVRPSHLEARMGQSGHSIFSVPLGDRSETRWGGPYLHIHRADYISALSASLGPQIKLHLGSAITDIEEHSSHVSVTLSDRSEASGDLLIGADGLHSCIRTWMHGPDEPDFTGNIAWRATVPVEMLGVLAPPATACVWMGPGRHAVTYRLRGGTLANFVGVVEQAAPVSEGWQARGQKSDAIADFAGWHPVITNLIESIPGDELFRWALYDRKPLAHWSTERVALLGDAAHPMLPFMAQGAAMAVEDSWALAEEISRPDAVLPAALQAYQNRRYARASRVQKQSVANAHTFHHSSPLAQWAHYGPMWLAGKFAPSLIRKRLDWLYSYDETRR